MTGRTPSGGSSRYEQIPESEAEIGGTDTSMINPVPGTMTDTSCEIDVTGSGLQRQIDDAAINSVI